MQISSYNHASPNLIQDLPHEVLVCCFQYVDITDLSAIAWTCRNWNFLCDPALCLDVIIRSAALSGKPDTSLCERHIQHLRAWTRIHPEAFTVSRVVALGKLGIHFSEMYRPIYLNWCHPDWSSYTEDVLIYLGKVTAECQEYSENEAPREGRDWKRARRLFEDMNFTLSILARNLDQIQNENLIALCQQLSICANPDNFLCCSNTEDDVDDPYDPAQRSALQALYLNYANPGGENRYLHGCLISVVALEISARLCESQKIESREIYQICEASLTPMKLIAERNPEIFRRQLGRRSVGLLYWLLDHCEEYQAAQGAQILKEVVEGVDSAKLRASIAQGIDLKRLRVNRWEKQTGSMGPIGSVLSETSRFSRRFFHSGNFYRLSRIVIMQMVIAAAAAFASWSARGNKDVGPPPHWTNNIPEHK